MSPENKIEFETEKTDQQNRRKILYSRIEPSSVEPKIIKFLISRHIIKNEGQADALLIAIFVICILLSVFIYEYSTHHVSIQPAKDAVLQTLVRQ